MAGIASKRAAPPQSLFESAIDSLVVLYEQTLMLVVKNLLLMRRNWKSTLVEFLAPVVFVLLLYATTFIPGFGANQLTPEATLVGKFPRCQPYISPSCFTLLYGPNDSPLVLDVMRSLVADNDLGPLGSDINSEGATVVGFSTEDNMYDWILNNSNATLGGIWFNISEVPTYKLYYNASCPNILASCADYRTRMMVAVNRALLNQTGGSLEVYTSDYPTIQASIDVVKQNGPLYFYCGDLFFFIILLYKIVFEKEKKLRQGMSVMGLRPLPYWLSWFIISQGVCIVCTLLLIATGAACQFPLFLQAQFLPLFFVFYMFIFSMCHMAFMLTTIIDSTKQAIAVGMAIFVIGIIFMSILSAFGDQLYVSLYGEGRWYTLARVLLFFLPPYHFAKILNTVNSNVGSGSTGSYTWADLTAKVPNHPEIPTVSDGLLDQLLLCFLFSVFAWYFDNVIPGGDRAGKAPWFFLTPTYWCLKRTAPDTDHDLGIDTVAPDADVQEEEKFAMSSQAAFRVRRLRKVYSAIPFLKRKSDFCAVQRLSLNVEHGSIFCLLGHNGAGKTTTINMLTGLFPPTNGDALIWNNSVVSDMDSVRKNIGVCPQHDILWPELTALEHVRLFAKLKRVPAAEQEAACMRALKMVTLADVANGRAGSFSGGMKRRLSVAIACIGDPPVLFLDEPTTGMDPMSKRHVWNLIQSIKTNKVVILTTHSMEEADILGDRIGIMVHGRLRCVGNSLKLKNKYGEGYRVNIVCSSERTVDAAKQLVSAHLPDATLITRTSEYLLYGLPFSCGTPKIVQLFRAIEQQALEAATAVIRDWGISHTSLEEVFLKVTRPEFNAEHTYG